MELINFILNNTPLFYWTQSLWRDEAFSVWIATGSAMNVIAHTSKDFNPPLYYLLLNFWMKIFGRSEIALRSLSLLFFVFFLVVVYKFALLIFKSKQQAVLTTIIAGLNPMLLYFAFELRMYSLLVLLACLSTYFLYTKQWKWYVLAAAAGMYTQPFMAFVLISHGVYFLLTKQIKTAVWVFSAIGLLFLPWLPTILYQFSHSGPMWMWPADINLVLSVLGNVFVGYEGTPGNLWTMMMVLSLFMILMAFYSWRVKPWRGALLLFYCLTFLPLILVVGISFIKPIYVHRYVIFAAIGEIFFLSCFISILKKRLPGIERLFILILIFGNFAAVSFHRKVDFRNTFAQISPQLTDKDAVYAKNPLSFYESWYYTPRSTPVFLYNPERITPPLYTGGVGMPESSWVQTYPQYPRRAFLVSDDGSYAIVSAVIKK